MVSRSRLALIAVSALLLVSIGCKQNVNGLGIQLALDKRTLPNGLTVIMVEDHTVPIVSYQTWFRVGSVDEKPGETGISHLFEHLMFKGTPKYGPKQFFQQLEAKGAEVNAFTTRDYTVYHENFVPSMLERVIDMESDRMANLTLDEDVLNSERNVVFEERRLRTDNSPEGKMQEALWGLAYRAHPYHWPVIGYPEDLMSIRLPTLLDYFHAHYQPANAAVIIVGDIKPDDAFALVRKYYGNVHAQPKPKRDIREEPEQQEERQLILHDHVASERLAEAYHVTAADNDDSYALDVLANILFEGTSSRAYRRMVDEKDIVMGVSGSAFTPTYPGLFIVSATMKGRLPTSLARQELDSLITGVQQDGVTDDEVKIAVKQLTVQLVDSVRTPFGLGQLIGIVQTIFNDPGRYASDLAKYTNIKASDVKRVAQKYLIPNNRSVVSMTPMQAASADRHTGAP